MNIYIPIGILFAMVIGLSAQPIQWPIDQGGNGHFYEFVNQQTGWINARNSALIREHRGRKGHLVSITSRQENQFVYNLLVQQRAPIAWIGLHDIDKDGVWRWIDGPDSDNVAWSINNRSSPLSPLAAFQNWPSNARPSELTAYGATAIWGLTTRGGPSQWQNFSPDDTVGFVVEYSPESETPNSPAFKPDTSLTIRAVIEIEWATMPGTFYRVQIKPAIGQAPWTDASSPIEAQEKTLKWLDRDVKGSQKIYRIIALDKP